MTDEIPPTPCSRCRLFSESVGGGPPHDVGCLYRLVDVVARAQQYETIATELVTLGEPRAGATPARRVKAAVDYALLNLSYEAGSEGEKFVRALFAEVDDELRKAGTWEVERLFTRALYVAFAEVRWMQKEGAEPLSVVRRWNRDGSPVLSDGDALRLAKDFLAANGAVAPDRGEIERTERACDAANAALVRAQEANQAARFAFAGTCAQQGAVGASSSVDNSAFAQAPEPLASTVATLIGYEDANVTVEASGAQIADVIEEHGALCQLLSEHAVRGERAAQTLARLLAAVEAARAAKDAYRSEPSS
jgi:hypothetical protein